MAVSILLVSAACLAPAQGPLWAEAPLLYGEAQSQDAIARLDASLAAGEVSLRPDGEPFAIERLLDALEVPHVSQTAVFSSASLQAKRITEERPRAVYFNDDVYIGFVPGGRFVEAIATDAHEGPVFYSLDRRDPQPRFKRETHRCLQCHAPSHTGGLPAHLMRSLTPGPSGAPDFGAGSNHVDPSTPFEKRWGGWYITGAVGDLEHLGNQKLAPGEEELRPSNERHRSLAGLCDTSPYPVATSDVVAVLVLEHQLHVQNEIVLAAYDARRALEYQRALNEALGDPPAHPVASSQSRLDRAAQRVVEALIGVAEMPLPGPVGTRSVFARSFQERGRRDGDGRSLRDLDLETRVFRYPLSYCVESTAMRTMPSELAERVWARLGELLGETLSPADESAYGAWLPNGRRQEAAAILRATLDVPAAFQPI
ncbi:MAG: hypothetical protein AAGG01_05875 [Planctomycetota bacterium]